MEAWEPRAGLADIAKFHTTAAVTATTFLQYLLECGLAIQKIPERLEIVPELPMTATGKIQ